MFVNVVGSFRQIAAINYYDLQVHSQSNECNVFLTDSF